MLDKTTNSQNAQAWYALYTKPRSEFKAAEQIKTAGVQYYLPTITEIRQWSDRKKKVAEPVLRGYIFIFANEKERIISLEQYSIVRCITEHGRPAKIPEWQIENLKSMLRHEVDFQIVDRLFPGTKVRIKEGPFEGIIGTIIDTENGKDVAISIDLLNRSVTTHLPKESNFEIIKV
jgi:transcription antitermination factor NusG